MAIDSLQVARTAARRDGADRRIFAATDHFPLRVSRSLIDPSSGLMNPIPVRTKFYLWLHGRLPLEVMAR
jgi:hypothetical protein